MKDLATLPLRIDLDPEHIHFIDNLDNFELCNTILEQAIIIGIDTETRPKFRRNTKPNKVSLLQIATRNKYGEEHVLLYDLVALTPSQYNLAFARVFISRKVMKLGQGLIQDLKELSNSFPNATCFQVMKNVVEVNDLSRKHLQEDHTMISLKRLTMNYLHALLSKSQQTSNWERRPLSKAQLHYAALDALVLLRLYDVLLHLIEEKEPTFEVSSVSRVLDALTNISYPCNDCKRTFNDEEHLRLHMVNSTKCGKVGYDLTLVQCTHCSRSFKTDQDLQKHTMHSKKCKELIIHNNHLRENQLKLFSCVSCKQYFNSLEGLNSHIDHSSCKIVYLYKEKEKDGKPIEWKCPKCLKHFVQSKSFHLHFHLCSHAETVSLLDTSLDSDVEAATTDDLSSFSDSTIDENDDEEGEEAIWKQVDEVILEQKRSIDFVSNESTLKTYKYPKFDNGEK